MTTSISVSVGDIDSIVAKEFPPKKITTKYKPKPKPKVVPKKPIERIFGSKDIVKEHYFSAGVNINNENQRNLLSEPSPFKYPEEKEGFSYNVIYRAWKEKLRKKELGLKYNERNNYMSRQQLDILNRLYVEEPVEQSMRTIFDIDPDFFTIVEGRPIADKFNIKEYITDIRNTLRTRIIAGYREDEIILINENFIQEQRAIDSIKQRLQQYVDAFEEFLYNDHSTSMNLLRMAEKEAQASNEKYEVFRELSSNYGVLKSWVSSLEEKWRNCKLYQRFLYIVSPMVWRKEHDYYHFKKTGEMLPDPSILFDTKFGDLEESLSLHDLINIFLDDCNTQEEPLLYFQDPKELHKVFQFMEQQNLHSLIYSEELAIPLENIKLGMIAATKKFDDEIQSLQEIVDSLQGDILWQEKRAQILEELAKQLIDSEFCKVISDEEVLNLYVFVEDVYENRVAPNDANLSINEMMKGIEMLYREYLLELDRLPQDKVHKAESECYAEEARIMKIAQEAARKVLQIERLARRLERVLDPPFQRVTRELKWRSPPFDPPPKPKPPPRPLTDDEQEYLCLFTDYCKYTDNVGDFGIDVEQKDRVQSPGSHSELSAKRSIITVTTHGSVGKDTLKDAKDVSPKDHTPKEQPHEEEQLMQEA